MVNVLTMDGTVTCGHVPPGTLRPTSAAKLAVRGFPVLVESSIAVIGPGCTAKQAGDAPCVKTGPIVAGRAVKLRAGGMPVILASLAGPTMGISGGVPGKLTVTAAQLKLVAS
ncbi:hypothetical protein SAMN05421504_101818 [Amycolatopsis xylanica]|uniref:PAAR motif-containing protein n=1 Tax=Amycolatopsis xylanica TaxID=589385 RepID=A0A1H2U8G1_9PSEU|nr:hypothetical protein [Amycolatopsis xylanica]SDW52503.1 hypothetical protein SAMN05421504_101818 [Amycolatopsis xylanica]